MQCHYPQDLNDAIITVGDSLVSPAKQKILANVNARNGASNAASDQSQIPNKTAPDQSASALFAKPAKLGKAADYGAPAASRARPGQYSLDRKFVDKEKQVKKFIAEREAQESKIGAGKMKGGAGKMRGGTVINNDMNKDTNKDGDLFKDATYSRQKAALFSEEGKLLKMLPDQEQDECEGVGFGRDHHEGVYLKYMIHYQ
jgi:hypothetical protein